MFFTKLLNFIELIIKNVVLILFLNTFDTLYLIPTVNSFTMKTFRFLLVSFLISTTIFSQVPKDFLSKEFHRGRREVLRSAMPENSVAVVFSSSIRNRSNDVDYVFHQDPNFFYLTGYREPNAVLLLFSEKQIVNNESTNEILYVQKRDARSELWNGKRLGVEGTKKHLGFNVVKTNEEFTRSDINFTVFDTVFINGMFHDDHRNFKNKIDLSDLIKTFKKKAGFNPDYFLSNIKKYVYQMILETPAVNSANVVEKIQRLAASYTEIKEDTLITSYKKATSLNLKKKIQQKITFFLKPKTNINTTFLPKKLANLREIKTAEELNVLTKAIRISSVGQIEVMKAMEPYMSETEIQGIHEFVYKKYGAAYEGYPSIVGSGNNGCILHYIDNSRTNVGNDLVLMDLGAEYRGYTADVTRTIPANGIFTKAQKEIYQIVLDAQVAGIKEVKVGNSFNAPYKACKKAINQGLYALGIIKTIDEKHNYLPHGVSHYLGLDVHDPGTYSSFQPNSVITVEPGIYIPNGSNCDEKYWGIAVRIEDDILITENGPINLSKEAPRTVEAIERMMAKKSVLNDFVLPNLED